MRVRLQAQLNLFYHKYLVCEIEDVAFTVSWKPLKFDERQWDSKFGRGGNFSKALTEGQLVPAF